MLRGAEVALGEVEAVLEDLPGVEQAVALVQEDPTGVQRLIAYVTPSSLSSTELMSGLRGNLPARMMPFSITPLAEVIDSSPEQPCSPVSEMGNLCAAAAPGPRMTMGHVSSTCICFLGHHCTA